MSYRYLDLKTDDYNRHLINNLESFKEAIEALKNNKVVLAHGYCARWCKQITYYVRDYSHYDSCFHSHICSGCGSRFFLNGFKGYIAMGDIDDTTLGQCVKYEIRRLNAIPIQKKILRDVLNQAISERTNTISKLIREQDEFSNLRTQLMQI
ncbi:hypothetical protein A2930_00920 [Candidatus Giovannonibacteria bacterium RIFCSPLOWO2_01_FULL_45_34]|uniref:Uncharacterized protein n=1 Tax=Candidatus Giovannonibacteria bacterium RIFCSPLOWO2_01_FULL_45_34 TaxID=1798351 RepID=A0A1F5WY96_9BACT|nr:MAG: hypothetical protein A3C73_04675 [Candidatus Giovannonibacteria bacterium RIFCSPHIGHO2_02_FULL_44_11]OGF80573.1 MAG: hypothetical protein A2930_00920 [Candidatus Giovannonibacteria bacterium RIFCSPLOWO2_01_FULL_45_34]